MKKETKYFKSEERKEIARPSSIEELSKLQKGEILEFLFRKYTGIYDQEKDSLDILKNWDRCNYNYSIFWKANKKKLHLLLGNFNRPKEYEIPFKRIQIEKGVIWVYDSKEIIERNFYNGEIEDRNEKEKLILKNQIVFLR